MMCTKTVNSTVPLGEQERFSFLESTDHLRSLFSISMEKEADLQDVISTKHPSVLTIQEELRLAPLEDSRQLPIAIACLKTAGSSITTLMETLDTKHLAQP